MTVDEALAAFAAQHTANIVVRHKRSGARYLLSIDIVSLQASHGLDFVYGEFADKHLGRKRRTNTTKWFALKNVEVDVTAARELQ